MSEKRVKLNQIVKNQVPSYVREDFPLVGEFLSQYYIGQEYKGGPVDLINNIDSYIKLSENGNLIKSTSTTKYAGISTETIFVSTLKESILLLLTSLQTIKFSFSTHTGPSAQIVPV